MATLETSATLPPEETKGPTLLILTCILTAFSITTTALRLYARYERKLIGWDDTTIGICTLLAIARTIIQIVSVTRGNGRHRAYLSLEDYQYVNFLTWVTQLFLFVTIALLKCSICLLILRIKNTRVLRICLYVMMIGLILTNGLPLLVLLAQCNPVKKYWAPKTPGRCWNTKVRIYSIYFQVAYAVITDLICTLLPVVVLWDVKIKPRLKFAISGLMSLGLIATICAIVRATSLGTVVTDLSYDYCIAAIWANTELHLGIIATNLSLARSIFAFYSGRDPFGASSSEGASGVGPRTQTGSKYGGSSRKGWVKSQSLEEGFDDEEDTIEGKSQDDGAHTHRRGSDGSQIPLGPVIKKTTEFEITEGKGKVEDEDRIVQKKWNQKPEVERGVSSLSFNGR